MTTGDGKASETTAVGNTIATGVVLVTVMPGLRETYRLLMSQTALGLAMKRDIGLLLL